MIKNLLVLSFIIVISVCLTIYLLLIKPGANLMILFFKILIACGISVGFIYAFLVSSMILIGLIELILFVKILRCD